MSYQKLCISEAFFNFDCPYLQRHSLEDLNTLHAALSVSLGLE
jgi:hypothetical protein